MRFKKRPQLPGAGRTRAVHHHGSHTPTSPEAILLGKMAHHTKQIRRECNLTIFMNIVSIFVNTKKISRVIFQNRQPFIKAI